MKKNKYLFVFCMLLAIALASGIFTRTYLGLEKRQRELSGVHVVTSFYPVYIAALNVVGDSKNVTLANLSEPQTGCLHDYQLTPQDMILLSGADLFLVNGGGIESFLADVGKAYPNLAIAKASKGIELLEEGENAHAWMDTRRYSEMVQNIATALGQADPDNQERYQYNADQYCEKIQELTEQLEEVRAFAQGKPVVILHEAYAYVAQELGMQNIYCLNLDEERQVSAREAAEVMEKISTKQVSVVLVEELYGKDLGNAIESETDAKICYLDTMVRGDYEADSYLRAVQKNIDVLRSILEHM
ncbi:MAG: zinc ABC transporter substrate-binding protein [Lachnospiraceae bacterium]|jgi:zinc transport system substrate-binding protein|nr:zinc ABC transporter substrate-binding protein [Lachnospiraceae bacterium]